MATRSLGADGTPGRCLSSLCWEPAAVGPGPASQNPAGLARRGLGERAERFHRCDTRRFCWVQRPGWTEGPACRRASACRPGHAPAPCASAGQAVAGERRDGEGPRMVCQRPAGARGCPRQKGLTRPPVVSCVMVAEKQPGGTWRRPEKPKEAQTQHKRVCWGRPWGCSVSRRRPDSDKTLQGVAHA